MSVLSIKVEDISLVKSLILVIDAIACELVLIVVSGFQVH